MLWNINVEYRSWQLDYNFFQNLDFLVFDYLSEVTMSLLTAAQQKNPDLGFAPDFVLHALGPYLKDIKNKGNELMCTSIYLKILSPGIFFFSAQPLS